MEKVAFALLMATGGNVIAPPELKRQALQALELEDSIEFLKAERCLDSIEDSEKKLDVIKALILTKLTPSEMMQLRDVISSGVTAIVKFVGDHPEYRRETSSEDAFSQLFGEE